MALKVKISPRKAAMVQKREGVNEKSGRPWVMRSQPVSVYFPGEDDPETITINLPDDCVGYPAGIYSWDVESQIVRGQYDAPSLSRATVLQFVSNLDGTVYDVTNDIGKTFVPSTSVKKDYGLKTAATSAA
jgi:hypothetical protein